MWATSFIVGPWPKSSDDRYLDCQSRVLVHSGLAASCHMIVECDKRILCDKCASSFHKCVTNDGDMMQ